MGGGEGGGGDGALTCMAVTLTSKMLSMVKGPFSAMPLGSCKTPAASTAAWCSSRTIWAVTKTDPGTIDILTSTGSTLNFVARASRKAAFEAASKSTSAPAIANLADTTCFSCPPVAWAVLEATGVVRVDTDTAAVARLAETAEELREATKGSAVEMMAVMKVVLLVEVESSAVGMKVGMEGAVELVAR